MNKSKYLVLAQTAEKVRALLFDKEHNYLADVDPEWVEVDELVKAAVPCRMPVRLARNLKRLVAQAAQQSLSAMKPQCFAVG